MMASAASYPLKSLRVCCGTTNASVPTGVAAYKSRSSTHIHLTKLRIQPMFKFLAGLGKNRSGSAFASTGSDSMAVQKSEDEWRAILSPEQFRILRQKGTEFPNTGEYNKFYGEGTYTCGGCGTPLYKSSTKFDSGCGWPAFFEGLPGAIKRTSDPDGRRVEITCAACGGHLGHVFKGEGFPTPTDERHCVNSISIKFTPANE
ncbi:hypothetical protein SUGI_0475410 [Cryptomeria japonica]|uniref:peptide methionine sulfoxide reductase B5 n=1 Tax=Cryptomeria japonica TaxID=3369 RepID=UPI00240896B5|nr:peptide methionine sulfoxide reductase B5 [Cryptomeria japonica]GLJ24859.1 hypothetical protein SUGI_0475410 [Cryptomeria japonica]